VAVHTLTVTDACSRFILACVALHAPEFALTRAAFVELFRTYGLPKAIRSDNGEPFVAVAAPAGLSRLSAWRAKLGIQLERIDPGKPQQNGRHEGMHLTLKLETASPPKHPFRAHALAFDRFRRVFNQQRPHEALGMRAPDSLYRKFARLFSSRAPVPQYPFADLCIVDSSGSIRWGNRKPFISSTLVGEPLGVYVLDGRYAEVRFANLLLGILDTECQLLGLIRPKPPRKHGVSAMSPV
jgi:putative transposase